MIRLSNTMKTSTLHEDLNRTPEVRRSSPRTFGLAMAGFFLVVGVWPVLRGRSWRPWALGVAIVFGAVAVMWPSVLDPVNRAWTGLGLLLQKIASPVVLGF